MAEPEELLTGGNLTPVVRVGDTVRRAQGPWSPAVHALLRHLERVGFSEAPRFLGVDMQQREILSYLPGVTGFFPEIWREESLVAAAQLLRRYHDATVGFQPPPDACWQMVFPHSAQHEVICHNDAAPYNLVFVDGLPAGMFDFDLAGSRATALSVKRRPERAVSYRREEQTGGQPEFRRDSQRRAVTCDSIGSPFP